VQANHKPSLGLHDIDPGPGGTEVTMDASCLLEDGLVECDISAVHNEKELWTYSCGAADGLIWGWHPKLT
jgi:hypothetical protein